MGEIVAELPCPHSGMFTYEEDMPHPNFKTEEDGKDNDIVHSYIELSTKSVLR